MISNENKAASATDTSSEMRAAVASIPGDHFDPLTWDGDNAKFVVEILLPRLTLPPEVRQVVRWAYGYDGAGESYERRSDGATGVADYFMGGVIKDPTAVGHDWLYYLHRRGLTLPNGERWSKWRCDRWFANGTRAFGFWWRAIGRHIGLTFVGWPAWWGWCAALRHKKLTGSK